MSNRKKTKSTVSALQWQCFGRIVGEMLAGWALALAFWIAIQTYPLNDLYWFIYNKLLYYVGSFATVIFYDWGTRLLFAAFVILMPLFIIWHNIARLTDMIDGLLNGVQ